ncbi:hypothetical protein [Kitasatospora sp. SUK 42]|uniref:hypothetical protein n=1 Tax=Kitasatospora sp. SUK 42 TaxID=1588882 RepID=UPI0018CBBF09|nr:hypothetical protein [Kitasatospora sp. SUK 42]MBV2155172.1 hypothetical protein [Kitasatospora sp. SUK 42]
MSTTAKFAKAARAAVVTLAVAAPFVLAGQAHADVYVSNNCGWQSSSDCRTDNNVLIISYNSNAGDGGNSSSSAKFFGNVPDYAGENVLNGNQSGYTFYRYVFSGGNGSGNGVAVKNNAAAAKGCPSTVNYRVYYNSNYGGHSQLIPGSWGCYAGTNLDSTLKNNNASQHWG